MLQSIGAEWHNIMPASKQDDTSEVLLGAIIHRPYAPQRINIIFNGDSLRHDFPSYRETNSNIRGRSDRSKREKKVASNRPGTKLNQLIGVVVVVVVVVVIQW